MLGVLLAQINRSWYQTTFTVGILKKIEPRLEEYQSALYEAKNVLLKNNGGVIKRFGFEKVDTVDPDSIIKAFEISETEKFLVLFSVGFIDVYQDKTLIVTLPADFITDLTILNSLKTAQAIDYMIIVQEDIPPKSLIRDRDTNTWKIEDLTFTNIPIYDYGEGDEPVWSAKRGYPISVTFHQSRLWFGGVKSLGNALLGSVSNLFFDFDVFQGEDTDAIFIVIASQTVANIIDVSSSTVLHVFVSGFHITIAGLPIVPANAGANKLAFNHSPKPNLPVFQMDTSTVFVDTFNNMRQVIYNRDEENFLATPLTVQIDGELTDVKDFNSFKSVNSSSNQTILVDVSGSAFIFTYIKEQGIRGWTEFNSPDSNILKSGNDGKNQYFIIERNGVSYLEKSSSEFKIDHIISTVYSSQHKKYVIDQVTGKQVIDQVTGKKVVYIAPQSVGQDIIVMIDIDDNIIDGYSDRIVAINENNQELEILNITKVQDNRYEFEFNVPFVTVHIGILYDVLITTLPFVTTTRSSDISLNMKMRINKVVIEYINSNKFEIQGTEIVNKVTFESIRDTTSNKNNSSIATIDLEDEFKQRNRLSITQTSTHNLDINSIEVFGQLSDQGVL